MSAPVSAMSASPTTAWVTARRPDVSATTSTQAPTPRRLTRSPGDGCSFDGRPSAVGRECATDSGVSRRQDWGALWFPAGSEGVETSLGPSAGAPHRRANALAVDRERWETAGGIIFGTPRHLGVSRRGSRRLVLP
jgi:hypothetical protein